MLYFCNICQGTITPNVQSDYAYSTAAEAGLVNQGWEMKRGPTKEGIDAGEWICPSCTDPFSVDLPANAQRKSKKIVKLIASCGIEHKAAGDKIEALKSKFEKNIEGLTFEASEKIQAAIDKETKRQFFVKAQAEMIKKHLIQSLQADAADELRKSKALLLKISKRDIENEKEQATNATNTEALLNQAHLIRTQYRTIANRVAELQGTLKRFK